MLFACYTIFHHHVLCYVYYFWESSNSGGLISLENGDLLQYATGVDIEQMALFYRHIGSVSDVTDTKIKNLCFVVTKKSCHIKVSTK